MIGVDRDTALQALEAGWSRGRISSANEFAYGVGLSARLADAYRMLTGPYVLYRDRDDSRSAFMKAGILDEPLVAYCDGSGTTMDRPAGTGVAAYFRNECVYEEGCHLAYGTNNVAELTAVWRALQAFPRTDFLIEVRTDSQYSIGVLTDMSWKVRKNAELVEAIRADLKDRAPHITFRHVRGHSGVIGNERADRLAHFARLGLPAP